MLVRIKLVNPGSFVVLNGAGSYDPSGGTIISYSLMQISGAPVALSGAHTTTPSFTTPIIPTDNTAVLAFSLRVMDNHGAPSANPAIVYVMVKHNPTTSNSEHGTNISQPQQQRPLQPIVPNNLLPTPLQPNSHLPHIGSFRP